MKVVIDRARLARRGRLAHAASLGGLLTLLGSVGLTILRPDLATPGAFLIVGGFAVATFGIARANRWVKRPRPEDVLDQALKGLDDRCRLYHYGRGLPAHLLLTPGGLVVLETRVGEGEFGYHQGRWSQKITLGKALRFFVEESLGDPIAEGLWEVEALSRFLADRLPDPDVPMRAVVVFTHPAARVSQQGAPIPIVQPKQLRAQAGRGAPALPIETYAALRAVLDVATKGSG